MQNTLWAVGLKRWKWRKNEPKSIVVARHLNNELSMKLHKAEGNSGFCYKNGDNSHFKVKYSTAKFGHCLIRKLKQLRNTGLFITYICQQTNKHFSLIRCFLSEGITINFGLISAVAENSLMSVCAPIHACVCVWRQGNSQVSVWCHLAGPRRRGSSY